MNQINEEKVMKMAESRASAKEDLAKNKALESALQAIEKQFGKGSILNMGKDTVDPKPRRPGRRMYRRKVKVIRT